MWWRQFWVDFRWFCIFFCWSNTRITMIAFVLTSIFRVASSLRNSNLLTISLVWLQIWPHICYSTREYRWLGNSWWDISRTKLFALSLFHFCWIPTRFFRWTHDIRPKRRVCRFGLPCFLCRCSLLSFSSTL